MIVYGYLDEIECGAIHKEVVAVKSGCLGIAASVISRAKLDVFELSTICKRLATHQYGSIVQGQRLEVACTPERLGGDLIGNLLYIVSAHIVNDCLPCRLLKRSRILQQHGCIGLCIVKQNAVRSCLIEEINAVIISCVLLQNRGSVSITVIVERERCDLGASAECTVSDKDHVVVDQLRTYQSRIVECAHADICKRFGVLECLHRRIFKRRITNAVDLVTAKQIFQCGAIPECMRADDVYVGQRNSGQILVCRKGVIFDYGNLACGSKACVGLSLRVFQQSGKDRFILLRCQGISVKNAAHRLVIGVLRMHGDGLQALGVAEGTIPNCRKLFTLPLTYKSAKFNRLHQLVAIECITVKANDLVKTIVVGNEGGNYNLSQGSVTGVNGDFLVVQRRLFTDDCRIVFQVNRIIYTALILVTRQNRGGIDLGVIKLFAPALGSLIYNNVRSCIKCTCSHVRNCVSYKIDLCGAALECIGTDRSNSTRIFGGGSGDRNGCNIRLLLKRRWSNADHRNRGRSTEDLFGDHNVFISADLRIVSGDQRRNRCFGIRGIVLQFVLDSVTVRVVTVDRGQIRIRCYKVAASLFIRCGGKSFARNKGLIGLAVIAPTVRIDIVRDLQMRVVGVRFLFAVAIVQLTVEGILVNFRAIPFKEQAGKQGVVIDGMLLKLLNILSKSNRYQEFEFYKGILADFINSIADDGFLDTDSQFIGGVFVVRGFTLGGKTADRTVAVAQKHTQSFFIISLVCTDQNVASIRAATTVILDFLNRQTALFPNAIALVRIVKSLIASAERVFSNLVAQKDEFAAAINKYGMRGSFFPFTAFGGGNAHALGNFKGLIEINAHERIFRNLRSSRATQVAALRAEDDRFGFDLNQAVRIKRTVNGVFCRNRNRLQRGTAVE